MPLPPVARHRHARRLAALLLLGLVGAAAAAPGRESKCWIGEDGGRQCGDAVPQGQGDRGVTVYDPQGRRTRIEPPTPTREEVQQEAARKAAQAVEQRRLTTQRATDRALLLTYPTIADLFGARDRDLAAIDTIILTARGNIRSQEDWARHLRSQAADLERTGKATPAHLSDGIGRAEHSIRTYKAAILAREGQKEEVRRAFDLKLQRYRQLTEVTPEQTPTPTQPSP